MKNQWTNFFSGSVKIIIHGKGVERFLNECTRKGISIWTVKKLGTEAYTCYILLKDVHHLRALIKKHECTFRFLTRKGFPFLIQYSLRNIGIIFGIALFLMSIFILSNMVWNINVNGANPETEHKINQELTKLGVKRGKLQFFIKDVESIQRYLTESIEEITWIGVELNGTSYHFTVVEKNEPEKITKPRPQHLVARKKATITNMFVEKGQPMVEINQYVKPGQILVSGLIGREENAKAIAAEGVVFGETWYEQTVNIELEDMLGVLTGESYHKHYVTVGSFSIPFWGFFKPEFTEIKEDEIIKPAYFWKWKLPISYKKKSLYEKENIQIIYTEDEAIERALEKGKEDLKKILEEDAVIKGQKVLHQTVENGKVKLIIHYQVVENIVRKQPIVQGD